LLTELKIEVTCVITNLETLKQRRLTDCQKWSVSALELCLLLYR